MPREGETASRSIRSRDFAWTGYTLPRRLSYVPLIAPATSEARMRFLCSIADSFIYVVSRMGITGATGELSEGIPELLARVHSFSGGVPAAVGFGVSTRQHFIELGKVAEGVVVGSQIIITLANAPSGQGAKRVQEYCTEITGTKIGPQSSVTSEGQNEVKTEQVSDPYTIGVQFDKGGCQGHNDAVAGLADQLRTFRNGGDAAVSSRFGEFGGQYVPESLMDCLAELEGAFNQARKDPEFWDEYRGYYSFMGRPGQLHLAKGLTEHAGGAKIWLKREDLNHTGSHKINNAVSQILLARRMGKTEIIAETGAGQHEVATAAVCAACRMKCTIYMGEEDVRRQATNVSKITKFGASIMTVEGASGTLRDAVNEAMRAWVVKQSNEH